MPKNRNLYMFNIDRRAYYTMQAKGHLRGNWSRLTPAQYRRIMKKMRSNQDYSIVL